MGASVSTAALVVGSVSLDLEGEGPARTARPGGVVNWAGLAFARLGARTRVVTSAPLAEADVLLAALRAEGVETHVRPSRVATTYVNDYSGAVDGHELREASDPIGPDDVPRAWRRADAIHLGPLHRRDVLPGVAGVVRGLVGLDVQGLLRVAGPGGTRLAPFSEMPRHLEGVSVVQASEQELPALLAGETAESFRRRHGIAELIVTRGARGARVYAAAGEFDVAARRVRATHKVGSGDVFLASYLFFRARGLGPKRAAGAAAAVCAEKVERGEVPKGFRPGAERA